MKKLAHELKLIARISGYFATVFLLLMVMKKFYLEDYHIEFTGLSQALIGALIMAKVIILLDLISFGEWLERSPTMVNIIFRTLLYSLGAVVVILLEKAFENRHKADGFIDGISYVFSHRDIYHVWATSIGVSISLFVYNAFFIIEKKLGEKGVSRLFFSTSLKQIEAESRINDKDF